MKDDVVIPRQDEVQVFATNGGDIAIHQEDAAGEEATVYFAPQHADALCDAIQRLAKQMLDDAALETIANA